jgi:hypothetical protein
MKTGSYIHLPGLVGSLGFGLHNGGKQQDNKNKILFHGLFGLIGCKKQCSAGHKKNVTFEASIQPCEASKRGHDLQMPKG